MISSSSSSHMLTLLFFLYFHFFSQISERNSWQTRGGESRWCLHHMLRQPSVKGNTAGGFIRAELESVPLQDCSMVVSPPGGWTGRAECFELWSQHHRSSLTHSLSLSVRRSLFLSLSLPLSLSHTLTLSFLSVSLTQSGLWGIGIFSHQRKVHRTFRGAGKRTTGWIITEPENFNFFFFWSHGEMERAVCSLF